MAYRTDGIGQDEARAFAAAEKQYPLSLEFAISHKPRAELTADVHVTIADAHGKKLLDTQSEGPFLLAKLPAGRYTVTAQHQGKTLTKTVHVTAHAPAHMMFQWTA